MPFKIIGACTAFLLLASTAVADLDSEIVRDRKEAADKTLESRFCAGDKASKEVNGENMKEPIQKFLGTQIGSPVSVLEIGGSKNKNKFSVEINCLDSHSLSNAEMKSSISFVFKSGTHQILCGGSYTIRWQVRSRHNPEHLMIVSQEAGIGECYDRGSRVPIKEIQGSSVDTSVTTSIPAYLYQPIVAKDVDGIDWTLDQNGKYDITTGTRITPKQTVTAPDSGRK